MVNIDDYKREMQCEYKGRLYSVRDNGAVYRHQKEGSNKAPLDNVWTFGKKDNSCGYMMIAGVRIHQIVARAFHGAPETPNLIVDHIDTNRCNNRPENLRWVTRLENALNNPITRAKIERICGSIEEFIANPSLLWGYESEDSNFMWMRTVTSEEAQTSYKRLLNYSQRPLTDRIGKGGSMGEWIYQNTSESPDSPFYGFKRWKIQVVDRTEDSSFPLAPLSTVAGEEVIKKYQEALVPGADFLISRYFKTVFREVVYFEEEKKLRVLSERTNAQRTPLYIFEIWADNDTIYHKIVGSYSLSKPKAVQEAMHDLTKYNRQEWKYKHNKQ